MESKAEANEANEKHAESTEAKRPGWRSFWIHQSEEYFPLAVEIVIYYKEERFIAKLELDGNWYAKKSNGEWERFTPQPAPREIEYWAELPPAEVKDPHRWHSGEENPKRRGRYIAEWTHAGMIVQTASYFDGRRWIRPKIIGWRGAKILRWRIETAEDREELNAGDPMPVIPAFDYNTKNGRS